MTTKEIEQVKRIKKIDYKYAKQCDNCDSMNTELMPVGIQYVVPDTGSQPFSGKAVSYKEACFEADIVCKVCKECHVSGFVKAGDVDTVFTYEELMVNK